MYYFLLEKTKKKQRGMGWVKYRILEDQGPFMFQNVLKVCLEIS